MELIKNKKGMTMIESIVALSLVAGVTIGVVDYSKSALEEARFKKSAVIPLQIIKAVDRRIEIDGYSSSLWGSLPSTNNTDELIAYSKKAFISKNNLECGQSDAWIPQLETAKTDALIPCDFGLEPSKYYDYKMLTTSDLRGKLTSQDIIIKLKSDYDMIDDNLFKYHKMLLDKLKANQPDLVAGFFSVDYTNFTDLTKYVDLQECMSLENNCAIKVSWKSDGFHESLRLDGTNNMINSHISFAENYMESERQCLMWEYDNNGSYSTDAIPVDCGIGIYNKTLNPVIATLEVPTVDTVVDQINAMNPIILKETCNTYKKDANGYLVANGTTECGLFTGSDDGDHTNTKTVKVIQVVENLQVDSDKTSTDSIMIVENLIVGELNISEMFSDDLTVEGDTDIQVLVGEKAILKDVVTMDTLVQLSKSQFKSDLIITDKDSTDSVSALDLNNGDLNIKGLNLVEFKADTNVVEETNTTRLTIEEDPLLNTSGLFCAVDLEGEIAFNGKNILICKQSVNDPKVYKWMSNRQGEILAFNGSCPSEWTELSDFNGRTLVGNGKVFDPYLGTIEYQTGQTGGKSFVKLNISEMPEHSHDYTDAYFSEHWGNLGSGSLLGEKGGQDNDNNLYTKTESTDPVGGDLPHENRSPFVVVKYCMFEDGDKASEVFPEPSYNQDDYWYPYTDEIGDWYTKQNLQCSSFIYKDMRPDSQEYWVRDCDVEKERSIKGREINYLTGVIRYDGDVDFETKTISEPEVWIRGAPEIHDWYDVPDPYNCSYVSTVENTNNYSVTLYCDILRERTYQETINKIDSNGNILDWQYWGELHKETKIEKDNFVENISKTSTRIVCGDWYLPSSEDNKPWEPELLCPRGETMDQSRTVYYERSCDIKATIYGTEYDISNVTEYSAEVQNLPDQPCGIIDLEKWSEADDNGNWEYKGPEDGRTNYILQHTNGDATIYQSNTSDYGKSPGKVIRGRIQVQSGAGDNDWVGFVIGKTDSNHFYLWSWKKSDQSPAYEGHALGYLTKGISALESGGAGMKNMHTSSSGYNFIEGYTDHDGSQYDGWQHGVEYTFRIEYSPTRMQLYIDDVLIFDEPPKYTSTYPEGAVGFFNKSQAGVEYYDVSEEPLRE